MNDLKETAEESRGDLAARWSTALGLSELWRFGEGWQRIRALAEAKLSGTRHGDLPRWLEVVEGLPVPAASSCDLDRGAPRLGEARAFTQEEHTQLERSLRLLAPWRKGPFQVFGVGVDAEWRSDLKWERFAEHLDFRQKRVLDVGSGNGYAGLRALGRGAQAVLGIDPSVHYGVQFAALRRLLRDQPSWVLPLRLEECRGFSIGVDVVFSMGVLYHQRKPLDHLRMLREHLNEGGTIVLETLIVEGGVGAVLVPEGRYAGMRNVWAIPSVATLEAWCREVGFRFFEVLDVSPTTPREQRVTSWASEVSLADALDPLDPAQTIEGHPAPMRGIALVR